MVKFLDHRVWRALASAAACSIAPWLAARSSHADILGTYNPQSGVYEYKVTNLPDFDQRRLGVGSIVGLPNSGKMYCVPTSSTDLLAYIANHGFPAVAPGPGNWQAAARYNPASTAIANLGVNMFTDSANGTSRIWGYLGLVGSPAFGVPPAIPKGQITVVQNFLKGTYTPRFGEMTKSAVLNKGLVALCHGWYQQTGQWNGYPVILRDGGHCLALQAVSGCSGCTLDVRLRDPGDEQSVLTTQSTFASAVSSVVWRNVILGSPLLPPVGMSEILPAGSDGTRRFLDNYVMLFTTKGYWFSSDQGPQIISYYNPVPFTGSQLPAVQHFAIVNGVGDLKDIAVTPDVNAFVYIAGTRLFHLDPLDGVSTAITAGDPVAPTQVMFGRSRGLYVLDGPAIKLLDIDASPPALVISRVPPNPCSHLVYDDRTDKVLALAGATHELFMYDRSLENDPPPMPVPAAVPTGGQVGLAISPVDGALWLTSSTFNGVWRMTMDADGNVLAQSFALPAVQSPQAVEIDDAGRVHISAGGQVRAFDMRRTGLVEVPDAPFAGLPGGPMLKLTHSRTNFEPGEHDTPAWRDVLAEDFAAPAPDCLADIAPVDGDGRVNTDDLVALITSWGPCADCRADIAPPGGDGAINTDDLLTLITTWGACPTTLPPRSADLCAEPNVVGAGTYAFITSAATTDGPALPPACDEGFGVSFEKDIWLLYSAPATGTLTVSTCGAATFDTRLAAYAGSCGALTLLACNDDAAGCAGNTSILQVPVLAGEAVRIRLGGYGGASGGGSVTLSQ